MLSKQLRKLLIKVTRKQNSNLYFCFLILGIVLIYCSFASNEKRRSSDDFSNNIGTIYPVGSRIPLSAVMQSWSKIIHSNLPLPYLTPALIPLPKEEAIRRNNALQSWPGLSLTAIQTIHQPLDWSGNTTTLTSTTLSIGRRHLQSSWMDHLHVILTNCDAHSPKPVAVFCPVLGIASASLLQSLSNGFDRCSKPLSNFSIRDRERLLRSPTIPRILFVRNPVHRLSTFHRRLVDAGPSSNLYISLMTTLRGEALPPSARHLSVISLPFLVALLSRHRGNLPPELAPFSQWCFPNVVRYSRIASFDNLHDQLANLAPLLQMNNIFLPAPTNSSKHLPHESIPQRLISKIERFYQQDVDLFHAVS